MKITQSGQEVEVGCGGACLQKGVCFQGTIPNFSSWARQLVRILFALAKSGVRFCTLQHE